jgi:DNA repair protein RecO (recombination protein O)
MMRIGLTPEEVGGNLFPSPHSPIAAFVPTTGVVHTEAIVLRTIDYGETSRIVTLFCDELGKTGVMAKGARAAKSRFGSTLQPMNRISTVIHVRPGRELQILSEASHVDHHRSLKADLARMELGIRLIELVNALLPDGEPNRPAFSLLAACLTALDQAPGRAGNVWPFFQMRLATLLGFGPSFEREQVGSLEAEYGFLDLHSGRISEHVQEGGTPVRARRTTLRSFAILSRADLSNVLRMELNAAEAADVAQLVRAYVQHHVEESYPTRSARVFAQFREGGAG